MGREVELGTRKSELYTIIKIDGGELFFNLKTGRYDGYATGASGPIPLKVYEAHRRLTANRRLTRAS